MSLSKALPPAQKPDPTASKSDDVPRQSEKGAPAVVHHSPRPQLPGQISETAGAGNGAGRARSLNALQRTIGNARLSYTLEASVGREPVNEQHLADVYGVDEVDQAKHAAHATPDSQKQRVHVGEPPARQSYAGPAVQRNYSEPKQSPHADLDQQVAASAFTGASLTVQKKDAKGAKKKPPPPATTIVGPPKRTFYTLRAATLRGVVAELGGREEAGRTDWKPHLGYKADDSGIVTSAIVTVPIPLEMPRWPGHRKVSKTAQAEWDRAYRALEAHEQGHVDLVHEHFDGMASSLIGKTEAQANAAFQKATEDLQSASDEYDQRTDHGQSAGAVIDTSKE
jgi:hypothetical protein